MLAVFQNFNQEISELREHIFYIKNVSTEIPTVSHIYPYMNSITKKKFNYKSLIISLYGIVENFSEKLIIQYLENLSILIVEYSSIKKVIQDNHIYNSANLTLKLRDQKYSKYNHLKENDLIKNLHSCINNSNNYKINFDSFTILSGNLKHSKVCELFKQIDVDLNREFLKQTDFSFSNSENQFKKLDELVEMRNEIAHGNTNVLLDPSEIEDYIDFIEKYFKNLFAILVNDLNQEKLKYWISKYSILLENTKVFRGNIIGFNNYKNILITQGSKVIIQKSNYFELATVLNIKKFKNNDITMKLEPNKNLKENHKFFLVVSTPST